MSASNPPVNGPTLNKMLGWSPASPQPAPLSPWYGRVGLAGMLAFLAVGVAIQMPGRVTITAAGAVIALGSGAALFLARTSLAVLLAALAVTGAAMVGNGHAANLAWFAVCIIGGWCALTGGRTLGVVFLAFACVLFGAEWAFTGHDPGWVAWITGTTITILAALLIRHQMTLVEQMRALQADLARRERAEERNRIARDLHDVIAHSLTVSLLHVSSARLAVEHDLGDAARALADAERLTRRSLDDIRATVGVLRSPDDSGVALPAPGIEELHRLVDDLRAAQTDITLDVRGDVDTMPATTSMTAYRIVQESLTNASRHATGATVKVRVDIRDDEVDIRVDSSGAPGSGTGMGLSNMKERAEAVGGMFSAGPGGSGWLVSASLPRVNGH